MELPIFVYFGNTLARGVGSGLKNAQLVDCHSSSVPALDIQLPNPPQIFNEDQIVLQRAQLDPVFVANAREVMKSRHQRWHASLQQTFPRKVDQFLFGGRALITRVWDLKKTDFVQLNATPPHPHPGSGRSKRVVWRKSYFFQVGTCLRVSKFATEELVTISFNEEHVIMLYLPQGLASIEVSRMALVVRPLCYFVTNSRV